MPFLQNERHPQAQNASTKTHLVHHHRLFQRLVPVHPRFRKYLCFSHQGRRTYQFRATPFGLNLSPRLFTRVSQVPLRLLHHQGVHTSVYLDHWIIWATDDSVSQIPRRHLEQPQEHAPTTTIHSKKDRITAHAHTAQNKYNLTGISTIARTVELPASTLPGTTVTIHRTMLDSTQIPQSKPTFSHSTAEKHSQQNTPRSEIHQASTDATQTGSSLHLDRRL